MPTALRLAAILCWSAAAARPACRRPLRRVRRHRRPRRSTACTWSIWSRQKVSSVGYGGSDDLADQVAAICRRTGLGVYRALGPLGLVIILTVLIVLGLVVQRRHGARRLSDARKGR